MKIFVSVLLLVVSAARASPQVVHGVVLEDSTNLTIAGALVELIGGTGTRAAAAVTDTAGAFLLRPRTAGSFTLRASHPGWTPPAPVMLVLRAAEIIGVELHMSRRPVVLAPVLVTSRRDPRTAGFYDRMKAPLASGQYLAREDIEARPAARTTELLRGLNGIEIVTGRGFAGRGSVIAMRGGAGRCLPTVYVDGVVVRQLADSGLDDLLSPHALEGIEVYARAGVTPASLPPRTACGVVAFWTRLAPSEGRRWSWVRAATTLGIVTFFALLLRD